MPGPLWKHENNVLVIVGGWNAYILLNSDWLKKYLFPKQEEFGIEVPLTPVALPPRISTDQMRISIAGQRLCFAPLNAELSQLDDIEKTASLVADFLPHTPVTALGINFRFELDEETLVNTCRSEVATAALMQIGNIREEQYRYSLPIEKGCLNVLLQRPASGRSTCELNFHHELSCLADIKEIFAGASITQYKGRAESVLATLATALRKGAV